MKIIGTIEARMGSRRLPGKTLTDIYRGMPLLQAVVSRFRLCRNVDAVWVATTIEHADDPIARWCEEHAVDCYRGSEHDILDRVTQTALQAQSDAIIQMGADSAYLDFELIDTMVDDFRMNNCDYLCNDLELTFPLGIYAHIIRTSCLVEVNEISSLTARERDDVARYIWEHPDRYRVKNITAPSDRHYPEIRLTIDYPQDLEVAREIYLRFQGYRFTTSDILELYRKNPTLFDKTKTLVQQSAPFINKFAHE